MQSSLISKIQKAHQYATERERISFQSLNVRFTGDNNNHKISYDGSAWTCDCEFFTVWQTCSHTMALEKILEGMIQPVPEPARA